MQRKLSTSGMVVLRTIPWTAGHRLLLGSWGFTLLGVAVYFAHDRFQASDVGKFVFLFMLTLPAVAAFRSSSAWAWAVAGFALALPALLNIVFIGGLVYLWDPKTAYHGIAMYLLVAALVLDIAAVGWRFRRSRGPA